MPPFPFSIWIHTIKYTSNQNPTVWLTNRSAVNSSTHLLAFQERAKLFLESSTWELKFCKSDKTTTLFSQFWCTVIGLRVFGTLWYLERGFHYYLGSSHTLLLYLFLEGLMRKYKCCYLFRGISGSSSTSLLHCWYRKLYDTWPIPKLHLHALWDIFCPDSIKNNTDTQSSSVCETQCDWDFKFVKHFFIWTLSRLWHGISYLYKLVVSWYSTVQFICKVVGSWLF